MINQPAFNSKITQRSVIWNATPFSKVFSFATFFLLPVYYFPSGGIQPCDIAIVLLFLYIVVIYARSLLRFPKRFILPFIPFIFWTITIGMMYQAINNDSSYVYLTNILYILFGFFIFFIFTFVFAGLQLLSRATILYFVLIACVSPIFFGFGNFNFLGRNTLSFNNPNQLGYYAVGIMTFSLIYLSLHKSSKMKLNSPNLFIICIIAVASNFFSYLSASRASILSIIVGNMIIGYLLLSSINLKKRIFIILMSFFIVINGMGFFWISDRQFDESKIYEGTFSRLKTKKLLDIDDFKKRTIGFIAFDDVVVAMIGTGGKISENVDFEVHNTVLNILKNYGFIGVFLLFAGMLIYLFILKPNLLSMVCLTPLIIYNMTHYGFRFRIFWLCLALFTASSIIHKQINDH